MSLIYSAGSEGFPLGSNEQECKQLDSARSMSTADGRCDDTGQMSLFGEIIGRAIMSTCRGEAQSV